MEMEIGTVIRKLRKEAGLNLDEVADHLGLDTASLSRKERGELDWDHRELEAVAAYFQLSVSELYRQKEEHQRDSRKAAWDRLYYALRRRGDLDMAFHLFGRPRLKRHHNGQ